MMEVDIIYYRTLCSKILNYYINNTTMNIDIGIFMHFTDMLNIAKKLKNSIIENISLNPEKLDINILINKLTQSEIIIMIDIMKHNDTYNEIMYMIYKIQNFNQLYSRIADKYEQANVEEIISKISSHHLKIKISSGVNGLDNILSGGYTGGELVIIAGRPAAGKTTLAIHTLVSSAIKNHEYNIVFFSLEMSETQVYERIICNFFRSTLTHINEIICSNKISYLSKINNIKVICHISYLEEILSYIEDIVKQHNNLLMILIDYIQLINTSKFHIARHYEIGYITRALKEAAIKFNVPIVVLSQLSRSIEYRQSTVPILSDLKDSGSIEQDADIVIAISYNLETNNSITPIHVLKNRRGYSGVVDTIYYKDKFYFD